MGEVRRRSTFVDITGRKFGMLTAIRTVGFTANRTTIWEFLCECGNRIERIAGPIISGSTISCGCLRRKQTIDRLTTHGLSQARIYPVWRNMVQRCHNPEHLSFPDYGGRGIEVCGRWRDDVRSFLEDMGEPPSLQHEIDRIDNNLGYCPENCRWVLRIVQANNKRSNHLLTFRGKTQTLAEWSRETGIKIHTIGARIRMGWSVEDTLTRPAGPNGVKVK